MQSDRGVWYETTFNTWGYAWPASWEVVSTADVEPQRFGMKAYSGLYHFQRVKDYTSILQIIRRHKPFHSRNSLQTKGVLAFSGPHLGWTKLRPKKSSVHPCFTDYFAFLLDVFCNIEVEPAQAAFVQTRELQVLGVTFASQTPGPVFFPFCRSSFAFFA